MNNAVWQLMVDLGKEFLLSIGASATTNMASRGSISQKQQIGAKRGATPNILQELIGSSPNTAKTHTGKLQRGARRAKRQLPLRDFDANCCRNCGCILPP